MEQLTPRQETLFGLLVQEYVKTAAPVGSRVLVESYGLLVSPATVRNDLARLEELGYLTHPHTSAGRVPTDEGYRYFVARLLGDVMLPLQERRTIAHQFHQARQEYEQWMPLAASVLTHTAHSAALVTAPQVVESRYKHLQLIATQGRVVLLILVLRGGLVKQQMLNLVEPLGQAVLSEASDRLNQLCAGLSASEIEVRIETLPPLEAEVARLITEVMHGADLGAGGVIYRDGLGMVLEQPEFAEGDRGHGLLRVMEERSFLESILSDALGPEVGSVRVLVGGEGRWDELRACSMVLVRYGVTGFATGALGVVGPTRMFYGRAISAVRFVAGLLSDLVYDMYAG
jgi:heat-inducible transcriptional repressor